MKTGIGMLADSRIANIKTMRDAGIEAQFFFLRSPFSSQVQDFTHRALLMVELAGNGPNLAYIGGIKPDNEKWRNIPGPSCGRPFFFV